MPRTHKGSRLVAAVLALALAVAAVAGAFAAAPASAVAASGAAVPKALDYVAACQRSDGGFAEKTGSASSDALTAWTIVAIASAGQDPNQWLKGGKSPVAYLSTQSSKWRSVTDLARTSLAASAANKSPRSFGGTDLIARIRAEKQDQGDAGDSFGPYVNSHIWSLLALRAAGETVSAREVSWLLSQQNADGGWGWAPEVGSDSNDTAAAIQALVSCGQTPSSDGVRRAVEYLRGKQLSGGGFSSAGGAADANSTAWTTQAIVALGDDPSGASWKKGSGTPMGALVAFQQQSGAVRFTASSAANPLLATVQAIPAFSAKAFPLAKRASADPRFGSAPSVGLVTPAAGSTVALTGPVTLQLVVSDGIGTGIDAGSLKVTVDGKKATARLSGTIASVGPTTLGLGSHAVVVSVADRAGNSVKSAPMSFTVATAAAGGTALVTGSTVATSFVEQASAATQSSSALSSVASSGGSGSGQTSETTSAAAKAARRHNWLTDPVTWLAIAAVIALGGALAALGVWWAGRRKAG